MLTRILLVEDFKLQRSLTAGLLGKNSEVKVICEAEDGPEAVAQAQQFRPDIILMDIGLPSLNGLEAARQISALLPSAKIVFLTQETDVDVVTPLATVQRGLLLGVHGHKQFAIC